MATSPFEFGDMPNKRRGVSYGALFMSNFVSTFLAVLLAGGLLLLGLQSYLRWSIQEGTQGIVTHFKEHPPFENFEKTYKRMQEEQAKLAREVEREEREKQDKRK